MAIVFHLLNAAKVLVIADALFSWVIKDTQFPRSLTKAILDPIYQPVRSVLGPRVGSIDLSPILALGVIFACEFMLKRAGYREPR